MLNLQPLVYSAIRHRCSLCSLYANDTRLLLSNHTHITWVRCNSVFYLFILFTHLLCVCVIKIWPMEQSLLFLVFLLSSNYYHNEYR